MTSLRHSWDLAGMTDERGLLGVEGLPVRGLVVPEKVWIDGDRVFFEGGDYFGWPSQDLKGMLDAFVNMKTAKDVRRFVERWGSLQICDHGLPVSHRANAEPLFYQASELE